MLSAVVIASDSCGLSKTVGSTNLRQRNADKLSDVCLFFFFNNIWEWLLFGHHQDFHHNKSPENLRTCLWFARHLFGALPKCPTHFNHCLLFVLGDPFSPTWHLSDLWQCRLTQCWDFSSTHPPTFTCGKYVHIKLYNRFDSGVNYALGRTSITWRHLSTCQLAVINTTLCSIHLSTEVW